jgi:hypothetical protein
VYFLLKNVSFCSGAFAPLQLAQSPCQSIAFEYFRNHLKNKDFHGLFRVTIPAVSRQKLPIGNDDRGS